MPDPFVKRSISLSKPASDVLEILMVRSSADRSAVLETGIRQLADLAPDAFQRAIRETLDLKKAATPAGWRSTFWGAMIEEFGYPPDTFGYAVNHPYGPRTLGECQIVFLLPRPEAEEDQWMVVHAFENARPDTNQSLSATWHYSLQTSPFTAARATAAWIRERSASS